ncbi:MAG: ABC transporter ATP-binding protein [Myxococcota bacterium]
MLTAERLTVGQRLCDVSLQVGPGQIVAIVGPNGAGKSTLLRSVLGLQPVDAGQVRLDGAPLRQATARERAAQMAWLPQQSARADGLSAVEVVTAARFRFRESRRHSQAQARVALDRFGLSALSDRLMHTLSGGERQRVRLAALHAQEAAYWLLDEPGNHLDPAAALGVWALLAQQATEGRGLVLVSHDISLLSFLHGVDVQVLALSKGAVAWTLPLTHDDLPQHLGSLLGLDVRSVLVDGAPRLVVSGVGA